MSVGYIGQYVGILYDFLYMLYDFIFFGPGAPNAAAYHVYFNSAMAAPVVGRVPAVTLAGSALCCCL